MSLCLVRLRARVELTFGFKLRYRLWFVPTLYLVQIYPVVGFVPGFRIHVLALVGVNVTFMLCLNYIRVGFGVKLEFNSCSCWNHDYLCSNTNLRSCKNSGSS